MAVGGKEKKGKKLTKVKGKKESENVEYVNDYREAPNATAGWFKIPWSKLGVGVLLIAIVLAIYDRKNITSTSAIVKRIWPRPKQVLGFDEQHEPVPPPSAPTTGPAPAATGSDPATLATNPATSATGSDPVKPAATSDPAAYPADPPPRASAVEKEATAELQERMRDAARLRDLYGDGAVEGINENARAPYQNARAPQEASTPDVWSATGAWISDMGTSAYTWISDTGAWISDTGAWIRDKAFSTPNGQQGGVSTADKSSQNFIGVVSADESISFIGDKYPDLAQGLCDGVPTMLCAAYLYLHNRHNKQPISDPKELFRLSQQ